MVGNVFFDMLTTETKDDEYGVVYPAWTVCDDKKLQISSDAIIKDKIERTISTNAEEVIIPIAGTSEINTQMHLSLRKTLKDKTLDLLKDESEMNLILQDRKDWLNLTSEYKRDLILPFMETGTMINEAITLNVDIKSNNVKVKEDRSATKDRYMALAMFNYFGDKIISKYNSDSQDDDYDENDWSFLSGDYSGY